MSVRRIRIIALALAVSASAGSQIAAQDYPSRPIRMIVPLGSGATDAMARIYADSAAVPLGQRVIVENRPGGNGQVGALAVKTATPDGYTVLLGLSGLLTVSPHLEPLSFDPLNDFEPVTLMFRVPLLLAVPALSPAKSLGDLLDLARKKPGGLNSGTLGIGTPSSLLTAMLTQATSAPIVQVSYKGSGPLLPDLVSGRLDMSFISYSNVAGFLKDGAIRVVAVASPTRWRLLPEVPTLSETGGAAMKPMDEFDAWFALMVPLGTPRSVVEKLSGAFRGAAQDPDLRRRFGDFGVEVQTGTPADLKQLMLRDHERMGKLIKDTSMRME